MAAFKSIQAGRRSGTYDICTGVGTTDELLAKIIVATIGTSTSAIHMPAAAVTPQAALPAPCDPSRAEAALHFQPAVDLDSGVATLST
jgi:nucleoside-diphosphate-sugar epimerase